jgi:hypothetical protein
MKKALRLGDSIYQQKGSSYGLTIKDGMLINNRADGVTGIRQAVDLKKTMKRAEKIATYSEAIAMGNMRGEMDCGCEMDRD